MHPLHIIASCADRKRHPAEVSLRDIREREPHKRAATWWNRLSRHRSARLTRAIDLYQGDHWAIARQLPETARASGTVPSLWVASAGYGLTPSEAPLHPYSATFSSGHADSVAPHAVPSAERDEYTKVWWRCLAENQGPAPGSARTVKQLAEQQPRARILILASPDYVVAMERDLLEAARTLNSPMQLIIVSGSMRLNSTALSRNVVPTDARLQSIVGGARTSLYVRVGRKILSELHRWNLAADVLQARYEALLARCPEPQSFDRVRMTDAEVTAFIHRERRKCPGLSCSKALRALRTSGRACEQHRFKELFHRTRESHA
jgi:hypothetical protein